MILDFVLCGESNKCIAHQLRLSRSTVSTYVARARRKLSAPNRVTLIAASASRASSAAGERVETSLTPAERAVVFAILAGKSNREIAAQRGTSRHTVANQIAAVFQKMGVGCRSELAAKLCRTAPPSGRGST